MKQTTFKGQSVTEADVLRAISSFDSLYSDSNEYENWQEKKGYKYALVYNNRWYPPKYILSQAMGGLDRGTFSGGIQATNRILLELGFEVINKS